MTEKWKRVSGSTLKILAILAMLIDHLGLAVILRMRTAFFAGAQTVYLSTMYAAARRVGRLAFPIFCFLLAEGFDKTKSRPKYLFRLGLFALISEIPYDLAFNARVLEFHHQNTFFTLFLGLLALCAYEFVKTHEMRPAAGWLMCAVGTAASGAWLTKSGWHFVQTRVLPNIPWLSGLGDAAAEAALLLAVCVFIAVLLLLYSRRVGTEKTMRVGADMAALFLLMMLADLIHADYAGTGVLTVTVIYILRKHNVLAMTGGCATLLLKGLRELPTFLTLIPIAMYNGKRGLRLKYFFYIFYPAHLLLLWLIAWRMGLASISVF